MVHGDQPDTRDTFIEAYDAATQVWGVAWNLSTGLYWSHPWEFLTLDSQSRHYINKRLGLNVAISGQQGPCDARSYLKLLDDLRSRFGEDSYPVHSFPDLSLASWMYKDPSDEPVQASAVDEGNTENKQLKARHTKPFRLQLRSFRTPSKTFSRMDAFLKGPRLIFCSTGCEPRRT